MITQTALTNSVAHKAKEKVMKAGKGFAERWMTGMGEMAGSIHIHYTHVETVEEQF